MPCNSDYLNPHQSEINLSRVLALHDELDGKGAPTKRVWDGYHERAYGASISVTLLDAEVARLCQRLKAHPNVPSLSLEMQLWWRDHQEADRRREAREAEARRLAEARRAALAKLTPEERRALGLRDDSGTEA